MCLQLAGRPEHHTVDIHLFVWCVMLCKLPGVSQVAVPLEQSVMLVNCTPLFPADLAMKRCVAALKAVAGPCNMAAGACAGVLGSGWATAPSEVTPTSFTPRRNQKQEAATQEGGSPADWASPGGGFCPRGPHPGQICLAAGLGCSSDIARHTWGSHSAGAPLLQRGGQGFCCLSVTLFVTLETHLPRVIGFYLTLQSRYCFVPIVPINMPNSEIVPQVRDARRAWRTCRVLELQ